MDESYTKRANGRVVRTILSGEVFGRWTVICPCDQKSELGKFKCRCNCGTNRSVAEYRLLSGRSKSCGCVSALFQKETAHDLTGLKRNMLTAIRRDVSDSFPKPRWVCRCDCGNETSVAAASFSGGHTKSCGCVAKRRGPDHPLWLGGHIDKNGYHITVVNRKSMKSHRLVMEGILGRPLLPSENVHHKNGVRNDNRPENLEVWVKSQPCGQRVTDVVVHAAELLARYSPDLLVDTDPQRIKQLAKDYLKARKIPINPPEVTSGI